MMSTAMRAAGEVRRVVDRDRVRAVLHPLGELLARRPTGRAAATAGSGCRPGEAPGGRWRSTPTPGPGRSLGERACGDCGRPRPTRRTASGSRSPPRAADRAPARRRACGRAAGRARVGRTSGAPGARTAPAPDRPVAVLSLDQGELDGHLLDRLGQPGDLGLGRLQLAVALAALHARLGRGQRAFLGHRRSGAA
jgi:hypothetical protein